MIEEVIRAEGHEHVTARHTSTLEVTTDDYLTPAGDCIVGINADRAAADFAPGFIRACRDPGRRIEVSLEAGPHVDRIVGRGHPELSFESERSIVARTSTYVDGRTVLVGADGAARDVNRGLIEALADGQPLTVRLVVEA